MKDEKKITISFGHGIFWTGVSIAYRLLIPAYDTYPDIQFY